MRHHSSTHGGHVQAVTAAGQHCGRGHFPPSMPRPIDDARSRLNPLKSVSDSTKAPNHRPSTA